MIHRMIRRRLGRRQGQGMTEYIVIVGLIAILLVAVVIRFKEQIRITIEGSDGTGGMTGGVNDAMNPAAPTDDPGNTDCPNSNVNGTLEGSGYTVTNGVVDTPTGPVPYDPAVHGPVR